MKVIYKGLLIFLLAGNLTFSARADDGEIMDRQGQFMAVYLLHFANFIEWPEEKLNENKMFNICAYGRSEVNKYIAEIEGEKVGDKKIKIIKRVAIDEVKNCHILFLSRFAQGIHLDKEALSNNHVLLVSDKKDFIEEGGVIQYYIKNNKLRIKINLAAAKRNKLKVSSKLIRIADIVEME